MIKAKKLLTTTKEVFVNEKVEGIDFISNIIARNGSFMITSIETLSNSGTKVD